jgi:hypothetical protein
LTESFLLNIQVIVFWEIGIVKEMAEIEKRDGV